MGTAHSHTSQGLYFTAFTRTLSPLHPDLPPPSPHHHRTILLVLTAAAHSCRRVCRVRGAEQHRALPPPLSPAALVTRCTINRHRLAALLTSDPPPAPFYRNTAQLENIQHERVLMICSVPSTISLLGCRWTFSNLEIWLLINKKKLVVESIFQY